MRLEYFNRFKKFIEFDLEQGIAEESMDPDDRPINGVADWLDSFFVALTVAHGNVSIHINEMEFLVKDGWPQIQYYHNKNGTTTCVVRDQGKTVELTYASWWLLTEATVPALGVADDEDEDLCAYLKLMTMTDERLMHLILKYSR